MPESGKLPFCFARTLMQLGQLFKADQRPWPILRPAHAKMVYLVGRGLRLGAPGHLRCCRTKNTPQEDLPRGGGARGQRQPCQFFTSGGGFRAFLGIFLVQALPSRSISLSF